MRSSETEVGWVKRGRASRLGQLGDQSAQGKERELPDGVGRLRAAVRGDREARERDQSRAVDEGRVFNGRARRTSALQTGAARGAGESAERAVLTVRPIRRQVGPGQRLEMVDNLDCSRQASSLGRVERGCVGFVDLGEERVPGRSRDVHDCAIVQQLERTCRKQGASISKQDSNQDEMRYDSSQLTNSRREPLGRALEETTVVELVAPHAQLERDRAEIAQLCALAAD